MAKHPASFLRVCSRCIQDTNQDDAEMRTRYIAIFGKRAPGYATDEARTRMDPFGRGKRCPRGFLRGEIRS
jgi:hypothetical protein